MLRMTYVSGKNGKRKRWVLRDDTGVIVAKLYAKPTKDFFAASGTGNGIELNDIESAASEYRARVNFRCASKGIDALY